MKQSELQIGSWYNSTKWQQPVMLTAEDIDEMVARADGASIESYIEEIVQPIPITPEWLERFGFTIEDWDEDSWYSMEDFLYLQKDFTMHVGQYNEAGGLVEWVKVPNKVKHVHQLQNLYFALTGNELNEKANH